MSLEKSDHRVKQEGTCLSSSNNSLMGLLLLLQLLTDVPLPSLYLCHVSPLLLLLLDCISLLLEHLNQSSCFCLSSTSAGCVLVLR